MNALNLSNAGFVLYQVLPKQTKIRFLYDTFFGDSETVLNSYFKHHLNGVVKSHSPSSISIIAFVTPHGDQINIIMDADTIHINCDRLEPINTLVKTILMDGNIIMLNKDARKLPQFYMKHYRSYKKLNPIPLIYPISLS